MREGRITFLDTSRNDWMWFHDHDPELKIKHDNVLYMYREPVATIYSNVIYQYFDNRKFVLPFRFIRWNKVICKESVIHFAEDYRNHLQKWLLSPNRAKTVICHDRIIKERNNEFMKICSYFGLDLDENSLSWAFSQVTKEELVKRVKQTAPMGSHILHKSYEKRRDNFIEVWGDTIREIVVTSDLKNFFNEL
ncbi:hypothetical protein ACFL6B_00005 [Thermodesulfobacteriota bacterium]